MTSAIRLFWAAGAAVLIFSFSSGAKSEVSTPAPEARSTPIFLIVLDGLSRSSLLDAAGKVDAGAYPNLASLAANSTRFTATTTVAVRIIDSIPAILTGRLPRLERRPALAAEYPTNLFSLLRDRYAMNILEVESALSSSGRSPEAQARQVQAMRDDRNEDVYDEKAFRRFVAQIEPTARKAGARGLGNLHFAHVRLPSFPWHLVPSGTSYRPYRHFGLRFDTWGEEPWWSDDAYRRHLLQLQFVDELVGEFLRAVKSAGLYEEAVIVLTADYGSSFWPGESRRSLTSAAHPEDMVHVPLWIKMPGQSDSRVSSRPAQTIDILPTILDIISVSPPEDLDGCSLKNEACPSLQSRVVVQPGEHGGRVQEQLPMDLTARNATLERKIDRVGSGRVPEHFYAHGPFSRWVGRRVEDVLSGSPEGPSAVGSARPHRQWSRWGQGAQGPRIAMWIQFDEEPSATPWVAVVRDGVIETIAPALREKRGQRLLVAMIPERPDLGAEEPLQLFLIKGSEDDSIELQSISLQR
ncbi:MAG: sulfatase-like hydrolase/transferase [Myxococcota bacterium]|nr:sulfatase-like hydrolase/transferase [Myxococcota bacterium]